MSKNEATEFLNIPTDTWVNIPGAGLEVLQRSGNTQAWDIRGGRFVMDQPYQFRPERRPDRT